MTSTSLRTAPAHAGGFAATIRAARSRGELVVQPRMGFSDPAQMREGLLATRAAHAVTVGTLTLDSYTRVGDVQAATRAVRDGVALNGYPLLTHGPAATRSLLDGVSTHEFPVQVRHGSPLPENIIDGLCATGLDATEGGPVSYCLPYGRVPLHQSVASWARACQRLSRLSDEGLEPHLESFGGCMLGQLCPPSLLIAISVLECLFAAQHGVGSVSLSYAQQTNLDQDVEALQALRQLAHEYLDSLDWHVVVYAYMGVYPATPEGAQRLLGRAAQLAANGAERLIVKTTAEAHRIPSVAENVAALEHAATTARAVARPERAFGPRLRPGDEAGDLPRRRAFAPRGESWSAAPWDATVMTAGRAQPLEAISDSVVYAEAKALVEAVLDLDDDIGKALIRAFARGWLDVPYCLHPDNRGAARSTLDATGRLVWSNTGEMPVQGIAEVHATRALTSFELLSALGHVREHYDAA